MEIIFIVNIFIIRVRNIDPKNNLTHFFDRSYVYVFIYSRVAYFLTPRPSLSLRVTTWHRDIFEQNGYKY